MVGVLFDSQLDIVTFSLPLAITSSSSLMMLKIAFSFAPTAWGNLFFFSFIACAGFNVPTTTTPFLTLCKFYKTPDLSAAAFRHVLLFSSSVFRNLFFSTAFRKVPYFIASACSRLVPSIVCRKLFFLTTSCKISYFIAACIHLFIDDICRHLLFFSTICRKLFLITTASFKGPYFTAAVCRPLFSSTNCRKHHLLLFISCTDSFFNTTACGHLLSRPTVSKKLFFFTTTSRRIPLFTAAICEHLLYSSPIIATTATSCRNHSIIATACIELKKISNCFKENKLSLKIDKTNFMIFKNKHNNKADLHFKIEIDNIHIEKVEVTKFLGILIDNNLSWKAQTNHITKIVSKYNGIIRKVRPFLNKDSLHTLYNTLVLPYLSYCTIVWGDKNNSNLDPLVITQKKIIRTCTNSIWLEHTTPLFLSLKKSKISDIYIQQLAVHMYRYHHDLLPPGLPNNKFTIQADIHKYNIGRPLTFISILLIVNLLKTQLKPKAQWFGIQ